MSDATFPDNRESGGPESAAENSNKAGNQIGAEIKWYRRKRVLIPLFFLFVLAVAVVIYWYNYVRGYVSTDDAFVDGDKITISARILGRIVQLGADEGDTVKAGQLLVSLDDTDLRAQEAQVIANLNYVRQSVNLARINLEKARDDFQRAAMQFKDNVITQEQYDHARIAQETAGAQLDVALAQVGNTEAQLDVVRTQLANTKIAASLPGVVAKRWVITGDVIQPGQPVFTIYNLDSIWVSAIFEETKLSSIRPGSPVEISVDAYPGRKFSGKVEMIGAAAASQFSLIPPNNASGNFTKVTQRVPIRILIDRQDIIDSLDHGPLLPGMSVEVKVKEE